MRKRGFTLIELLVVVAVLGILAEISVPIVSDSLLRAKIARMKNDTRILGMAIESYVIDYGWYPYGKNCEPTSSLCCIVGVAEDVNLQIPQLVSPIKYINSFPEDLFNWKYSMVLDKYQKYTLTYTILFQLASGICQGDAPASDIKSTFTWSAYSLGPDEKPSLNYNITYWMQMPYDSSNGIRSMGDIAWSTQPPPIWEGS